MARKNRTHTIPEELLDELLKTCKTPDDLTGETGLLKELKARLVERVLEAEMTDHLGYERHDPAGRGTPNSRNGVTSKTLKEIDPGICSVGV